MTKVTGEKLVPDSPPEQPKIGTAYSEIARRLNDRFDPAEERTRPQAGRQLSYITARAVARRLDSAVGWENWWDEYIPSGKSIICRLSIRLPDGTVVTKCDAGGFAGMNDPGDDEKSGFSDAFKRAAVKFGVGRYLYNDTVRDNDSAQSSSSRPASRPDPRPNHSGGNAPNSGRGLFAWCKDQEKKHGPGLIRALNDWAKRQGDYPDKMVDWSAGQTNDAHVEALRLIADHVESRGPTSPRDESLTDKRKLLDATRQYLGTVHQGHVITDDQVMRHVQQMHESLYGGECLESLKTYTDVDRLREMTAAIERDREQATADAAAF